VLLPGKKKKDFHKAQGENLFSVHWCLVTGPTRIPAHESEVVFFHSVARDLSALNLARSCV